MAKKIDKAVKDLAKEVKKLRKENEKLAKGLNEFYEDQAAAHRELRNLLEERQTAASTSTDEPEEAPQETGTTAESNDDQSAPEAPADGAQDHEDPELTDAAKRRAEELGVDPTSVEGTGSGGRVLVKDVEAAAGQ